MARAPGSSVSTRAKTVVSPLLESFMFFPPLRAIRAGPACGRGSQRWSDAIQLAGGPGHDRSSLGLLIRAMPLWLMSALIPPGPFESCYLRHYHRRLTRAPGSEQLVDREGRIAFPYQGGPDGAQRKSRPPPAAQRIALAPTLALMMARSFRCRGGRWPLYRCINLSLTRAP